MKSQTILLLVFFISTAFSQPAWNVTNLEFTKDELLTMACINPEYANSTLGQKYCQGYTMSNNTSVNETASNCVLQYWQCCKSNWIDNNGTTQTLDTCVKISKCDNFYEKSTCVTPSVCMNSTCPNAPYQSLVNNSNINDQTIPQNIDQFLAQENNSMMKVIKKFWIRDNMCVGNYTDRATVNSMNCCTNCQIQRYTLTGDPAFNYTLPDFSTLSPVLLAANMTDSFLDISADKTIYFTKACKDDRVQSLFGIQPSDEINYTGMCQNLAYDYGQYFGSYQCNDWYCNHKGTCSISNTSAMYQTVVPTCACNAGYRGKNCMFPDDDYNFAMNYSMGLDSWVDNNFGLLIDDDSYVALVRMLMYLIPFTSNADLADQDKLIPVVSKLWTWIALGDFNNSNIAASMYLDLLADSVTVDADNIKGLDPRLLTLLLSNYLYNVDELHWGIRRLNNTVGSDAILGGSLIGQNASASNNSNTSSASNSSSSAGVIPLPSNANNASSSNANVTNVTVVVNGNGTNSTSAVPGSGTTGNSSNITILNNGTGGNTRRFLQTNNTVTTNSSSSSDQAAASASSNKTTNSSSMSNVTTTGGAADTNMSNNATSSPGTSSSGAAASSGAVISGANNSGNTTFMSTINNGSINQMLVTPKVIVPANVTSLFPNQTVFGMMFWRNPRPFILINESFINTQMVKVFAFGNVLLEANVTVEQNSTTNQTSANINITTVTTGAANPNSVSTNNSTSNNNTAIINSTNIPIDIEFDIPYPQGQNLTVFLPWTYVPLMMGNNTYVNSCYVLSFNGTAWANTPNCTVLSQTDQNQAVIGCNQFGTYGVRCISPPLFANNTNSSNLTINSTGPLVQNFDFHSMTVGAGTSGASSTAISMMALLAIAGILF